MSQQLDPRILESPRVPPLAIATVLAIAIAAWSTAHLACISRDGTHYIEFAKQLAIDPVFYMRAQKSQPGFSALILAAHAAFGRWFAADPVWSWLRAGQFVAVLGYVACVPLIYLLTRRLFSPRPAAVAAGLAALWPQAAQLAGDVLSDMPHLALYLAAVLIGGHALLVAPHSPSADPASAPSFRRPLLLLGLAGVVSALAYLVRQEALALPIALVGVLWWTWRSAPHTRRRRLLGTFVIGVAFLAPLTPYKAATGSIMHKKGLYDLFFRSRSPAADAQLRAPYEKTAAPRAGPAYQAAAASPPYVEFPLRLLDAWSRSGRYVLSTLVLIGLFARPRAHRDWRRFLILLIALQCLAVERRCATFGEFSSRYALIPVALTIPWAAAGLCAVIDYVTQVTSRSADPATQAPRVRALWGAAWLIVAAPMAPYALAPINGHDAYLRRAGEWLASHSRQDDEILAEGSLSRVTYYAGRRCDRWIDGKWSLDDLLNFDAQRAGRVRWYVQLSDRQRPAQDDELLSRVLKNPRWPGSWLAYRDGPPGREVRIVHLRENGDLGNMDSNHD